MKRKIFQTEHGRVMFSLIKGHKRKQEVQLQVRLHNKLPLPINAQSATFSLIYNAKSRRKAEQFLKKVDIRAANEFASHAREKLNNRFPGGENDVPNF